MPEIRVDLERVEGPANTALAGLGWNTGDLSVIAPFEPPVVRIDAHLDEVSPEPGTVELGELRERVAAVRSAGAEPLVILYPMPAWLADCPESGCADPTKRPPRDVDAWRDLVEEVVGSLAEAPEPAVRFEVWNEPDIPVFWHESAERFYRTAVATHEAVVAAEAKTGIDLDVGGPAAALPGGERFRGYLSEVRDAGLPMDFVSWHWYANSPNLGPDGNEGLIPDALYEQLAGRNPQLSPAVYGEQAAVVREAVEDVFGPDGDEIELVIDEWNVSAGGLDRWHDGPAGAAFAAAALIEMERGGVDAANYYRAVEAEGAGAGDWGLVTASGERQPAWWVLQTWATLEGDRVAVDGDVEPVWARAVRSDGGGLEVLVASFDPQATAPGEVELVVDGGCAGDSAELRRIGGDSRGFDVADAVDVARDRMLLDLEAWSVTWLTACADGAEALHPATGDERSGGVGPVVGVAAGLAAGAGVGVWITVWRRRR